MRAQSTSMKHIIQRQGCKRRRKHPADAPSASDTVPFLDAAVEAAAGAARTAGARVGAGVNADAVADDEVAVTEAAVLAGVEGVSEDAAVAAVSAFFLRGAAGFFAGEAFSFFGAGAFFGFGSDFAALGALGGVFFFFDGGSKSSSSD